MEVKITLSSFLSTLVEIDGTTSSSGSMSWLLDLERVCALLIGRSLGMMLVGAGLSVEEREVGAWLMSPLFSNGLESVDVGVIGMLSFNLRYMLF